MQTVSRRINQLLNQERAIIPPDAESDAVTFDSILVPKLRFPASLNGFLQPDFIQSLAAHDDTELAL